MSEREILLKANGNSKKISDMWSELVKNYANRVVAVEDGKIIGDAKTSVELVKTLENQKKNLSYITIISVPPANVAYIL